MSATETWCGMPCVDKYLETASATIPWPENASSTCNSDSFPSVSNSQASMMLRRLLSAVNTSQFRKLALCVDDSLLIREYTCLAFIILTTPKG
jgi:hypothetical protein